ncbi:MAG: WXG100 family type VII secretion target, partial [Nocardioidaceae bacterium]
MAGPHEHKLAKVLSADPGAIHAAARDWATAAEGLQHVEQRLAALKSELLASWDGRSSAAAGATFDSLRSTVQQHRSRMSYARDALNTTGDALTEAKAQHAALPSLPAAPTTPDTSGMTDSRAAQAETAYLKQMGVHQAAADRRESEAAAANRQLESRLAGASQDFENAAPGSGRDPQLDRAGEPAASSPAGGAAGGPGAASGVGPALVGGSASPYGSGSGGSHVGGFDGSTLGSTAGVSVSPGLGDGAAATADGVVEGVVPGSALPGDDGDLTGPGHLVAGDSVSGATGSLSGGVVGSVGGGVAGAGAALGAIKG